MNLSKHQLMHGGLPPARRVVVAAFLAPLAGYLILMIGLLSLIWMKEGWAVVRADFFENALGFGVITGTWALVATWFVGIPLCFLLARFGYAGAVPVVCLGIALGVLSLAYFGLKYWPLVGSYAIPVPLVGWWIVNRKQGVA